MAKTKKINLALQGGGAHGAFTWGVLDRLLEEEDLEISGISGTSAGALNGAALKSGMITGGRQGARDNLEWLWMQVAGVSDLAIGDWMAPFGLGVLSKQLQFSWPVMMSNTISRMVSPYDYGLLYKNPLREIVEKFDYDRVCDNHAPLFFVGATRLRNGKIRVFEGDEIGPDALMASACLPTVFQAIKMFDKTTGREEAFWDGGYSGNPALFPLFSKNLPPDIVIININPLERDDIPTTPADIQNRINEISFNSSLLRELRAVDFVQRLIEEGTMSADKMHRVYIHMIADDTLMAKLSAATKMVAHPNVIGQLKAAGRTAAETFLRTDVDNVGRRSSVDLRAMFD
ncbi:patatin-like phospholipase family protein [Sulfitobacter guttiformis]|uniref:NTE family protein n=1 Tax=Sulfitobacter guttiformis TaxID=74349 RepID=A0A420DI20_9RHOB|nr:patatin-like phospholipase family protein [Sulfitobacter guttiformis]KIN72358.1 Phospholipase, patatin-like family protein [Sulfitobacter guttiformis KCTC 32187]RKE93886.1 NTE family protein [Sulfitobacter guttiformis]